MKEYRVAVVGATGAVGQEMIKLLELRKFPVKSLRLLASSRSVGKKSKFGDSDIAVEELKKDAIPDDLDIALFSAGATVSKEYAPLFAQKGIFVIDNSSAWRMDPAIPLVVPEVNPQDLSKNKKLIANPNCSTIQMVVVLKPIHDYAIISRVIVSTYQSVSGAGGRAMEELRTQTETYLSGRPVVPGPKFAHQIAFNLIPQIDVFTDNLYTKEEMKMVNETQKIMGDKNIKVSATCVRVPVYRSHSETVWIETDKKLSVEKTRELLSKADGITVVDDPKNGKYPMPLDGAFKDTTFVGRIREDLSCDNGITLWIVSDNLWKGAALNAVQIAEMLIAKGIL